MLSHRKIFVTTLNFLCGYNHFIYIKLFEVLEFVNNSRDRGLFTSEDRCIIFRKLPSHLELLLDEPTDRFL